MKKFNSKKIAKGCLSIPIALIAFYSAIWIVHEMRRDTIKLNDREIMNLEKDFNQISANWDKLEVQLSSKFEGRRYLSKNEFLQLLKSSNISEKEVSAIKEIALDDSTIEICDKTFGFEIFSSSDPHVFFPDCYRHYVSFNPKNECPTLNSFDGHDIIKDELLGKKLRYIISRHFWD